MREDIINTIPEATTLGRREFFVTSIAAAGTFAAAVTPIAAQTKITTDDKGLVVGEVKIQTSNGVMPAYRAMPDKKGGKFPVVMVVHEIFGVHEWIQDICRRFAKLGYMAVAPALYFRVGEVTDLKNPDQIQRQVFSKIPDTESMADLDSTVAWAAKNSGNTKKLSITGFCWGGRIVWLYAAHNKDLDAGAAWYGRVVPTPNSPVNSAQPKTPIDYAADLKAPVIGLYGGQDKGIPLEGVNQMKEAIAKGKTGSQIVVYPDADHGFLADYRPTFHKESAEDAWAKTIAWFKKNGAF